MKVFRFLNDQKPERRPLACALLCTDQHSVVTEDACEYLSNVFRMHYDGLNSKDRALCRCTAEEIVSVAGTLEVARAFFWRREDFIQRKEHVHAVDRS